MVVEKHGPVPIGPNSLDISADAGLESQNGAQLGAKQYSHCTDSELQVVVFQPFSIYSERIVPVDHFNCSRHTDSTMNTVKTKSGAQINPFASITDLLSGTSFNSDGETRGHLQSLATAFHEISQTDHGQMLLSALEGESSRSKQSDVKLIVSGLATKIKTEVSFKDGVKVCFRLAKKISSSPWVNPSK